MPLWTRAIVAMNGTFGYELDPNKLTDAEKNEIREQIACFKRHRALIAGGDYYRLNDPQHSDFGMWQYAACDGSEALLAFVQPRVRTNAAPICLRLHGLDAQATYRVDDFRVSCQKDEVGLRHVQDMTGMTFTGAQLMYAGFALPRLLGDCPALLIHFVRV